MKIIYSLFALIFIMICGKSASAQNVYIDENFNTGIPGTWSISPPVCGNSNDTTVWEGTNNGWRGQGLAGFSLDSSEFAIVDSDLPNLYCQCNEFLTTPVFDASTSASLTLEFDQYYKHYINDYVTVYVFDGTSWVALVTFTSNTGNWIAPNHQSIDLTSYINSNMQIRFQYNANWDWFWALDNIRVVEYPLTGYQELTSETTLNIFPNPFSSQTTLQTDILLKDATIIVYNAFGQKVKQIKNISGHTITLKREDLSNGMYFLRLMQNNNMLNAAKIVITGNY